MSGRHPQGKNLIDRFALRRMGIWYSNTHMLRMERAGKFPKRYRLSPQKVVWDAKEIHDWLAQKAGER